MSRNPDSTLPAQRIACLVLIAPGAELLAACADLVRQLDEIPNLKVAAVATAATVLAEWRPFAVVVPEPVFAFDTQEFASLAHTVGAEVIVVGADDSRATLAATLLPRLRETLSWWQSKRAVSP